MKKFHTNKWLGILIFVLIVSGIYGFGKFLFLTNSKTVTLNNTVVSVTPTVVAANTAAQGFNYDSYEPMTYAEFENLISSQFEINKRENLKGLDIFNKKVRINEVVLTEYPAEVSNSNKKSLEVAVGIVADNNQKELISLFGYQEVMNYKWGKINLFFQSGLVPHLRSEQVLGKKIILYGILTHLNDFGNEATVLVNEFDAGAN